MKETHITPPPFNKAIEPQTENPETGNESHGLDSLGLDEKTQNKIEEMLLNAETQGYLRGRNEKIEATQHFDAIEEPEVPTHSCGIPIYSHRSVWDR